MSIDFCNECDHVVEGDTIACECPNCGETLTVCRHCLGTDVVGVNEDDPMEDR